MGMGAACQEGASRRSVMCHVMVNVTSRSARRRQSRKTKTSDVLT